MAEVKWKISKVFSLVFDHAALCLVRNSAVVYINELLVCELNPGRLVC